MEMEMDGPYIRPLEMFNMCFDYDVSDRYKDFDSSDSSDSLGCDAECPSDSKYGDYSNIISCDSDNKGIELPGHFRGRIVVCDTDDCDDCAFTENMEMEGPHIRRLELFNMCFDYDVSDRYNDFGSSDSLGSDAERPSDSEDGDDSNIISCDSDNKGIELPGYFRGRIFVCDTDDCDDCAFNEIYNSDTVDSVYVELPNTEEMQDDSDSSQKSSKRKMGGSISCPSSQKRTKQNNGDSTFRDTEEMQVADEFSKSSGNLINLPLTGPNEGMIVHDSFLAVIHKDTGNRDIEDQYELVACNEYSHGGYVLHDDVRMWRSIVSSNYDTPFGFHLYNDFRKLQMNCMVMKNSKVVDVQIKWCMPTSYICGEISVSCDKFFGNKCHLIQTPQKKFVMAEEGKFIKLCRFTVAVPYSSDFTVSAMLHDPNNVLLVNESVSFPFVPLFTKDPKNHSYKSTLTMKGITCGCIEVVAIVYL